MKENTKMKKLMIAAAIVCAAVMAQAATYNWNVSTTSAAYDGYNAPTIGSVWKDAAILTSAQYYMINSGTYTQSELLTAMRKGEDWSGAVLTSGKTDSSTGLIATKAFSTTSTETSLTAYAIIVDGDNVYFSKEISKTGDTQGGTVSFQPALATSKIVRDKTGSASYASPGWYSTVPEPTSGLLLLLGMAGLALRRRRA